MEGRKLKRYFVIGIFVLSLVIGAFYSFLLMPLMSTNYDEIQGFDHYNVIQGFDHFFASNPWLFLIIIIASAILSSLIYSLMVFFCKDQHILVKYVILFGASSILGTGFGVLARLIFAFTGLVQVDVPYYSFALSTSWIAAGGTALFFAVKMDAYDQITKHIK
jgi:hypothetical protein